MGVFIKLNFLFIIMILHVSFLYAENYNFKISSNINEKVNNFTEKNKFNLNFGGYFKIRSNYFFRCNLGTFIPSKNYGTSSYCSNLSYSHIKNNKFYSLLSTNMHFCVDPILNISKNMQIKSRIAIFNNIDLCLISTNAYNNGVKNCFSSYSFLSIMQNNINNYRIIGVVKRLFGELSTSIGKLRFGRFPLSFGLGVFYNDGENANLDYSDSGDGFLFSTKILKYNFISAYIVSNLLQIAGNKNFFAKKITVYKSIQKYDLDNVHTFFFIIAKKNNIMEKKNKLNLGQFVLNYSLLTSYNFQYLDSKLIHFNCSDELNKDIIMNKIFIKNSHVVIMSFWSNLYWRSLSIESELVGCFSSINSFKNLNLKNNKVLVPIKIYQYGGVINAKYMLINNMLKLGVDIGFASGDRFDNFYMSSNFFIDKYKISNFIFNPNYIVDFLLFKEILNGISGSCYLKSNILYDVNDRLIFEGSTIFAFSNESKKNSEKIFLGMEFNIATILKNINGFYMKGELSWITPFSGLNHPFSFNKERKDDLIKYGIAKYAFGLTISMGIKF